MLLLEKAEQAAVAERTAALLAGEPVESGLYGLTMVGAVLDVALNAPLVRVDVPVEDEQAELRRALGVAS